MSGHEVRVLEPAERPAAVEVFHTALVAMTRRTYFTPEDPHGDAYFEKGRLFGAFVDGQLVGTTDGFTGWLAVPGGRRLPHTAVTGVGVLPTHTRRGLLTALMRAQLADAAARGDAVATLRASEATIYGRFGYGLATQTGRAVVTRARARWCPTAPRGGPVRLVDPVESWDLLARIHERLPAHQPGAIGRPGLWWNVGLRRLRDHDRPSYVVVHGEPGAEDGFACYHPDLSTDWHLEGDRTIVVDDLVAGTPAARAGLLRHLLRLDLVDKIVIDDLPLDDPLPAALTDHRAVRFLDIEDETWLRLLDVPAALAARTYQGAGSVVVEVVDDLLPANSGAYEISQEGATRLPASAPVPTGLRVDVAGLGAVYLGGTRWWQLAAAGRADVRDPAALTTADALFATGTLPYSGTRF
ncbi:GNAT family N-acetyltransferase [Pseudofrankia saprophytica]|uniref:GNAT family N-acetyltransferase n=1 Tax=Pseudofrankia saprophytica TaxID=298655 RepID=UPI000234CE8D|nr:GNAT family N-acetyltransferase [Pseudofrankia saprophytica]